MHFRLQKEENEEVKWEDVRGKEKTPSISLRVLSQFPHFLSQFSAVYIIAEKERATLRRKKQEKARQRQPEKN